MYGSTSHTRGAAAIVASAGLALLAAACGSSNRVASVSSTSAEGSVKAASSAVAPAEQAQLRSDYPRFARCMRSHGVSDFPDPIIGSGGHPGFRLQGGSGSDLNSDSAAFRRGVKVCQHTLGHQFRFVFTPSGVGKGG
jgi:hypothetical protein